jgi:MFS family permease
LAERLDSVTAAIRQDERELNVSKATVTRLFIGAGLAMIAGAILAIAGVWVAIANDVFVMNGPDIVGLRGSAAAWSTLGLATVGVVAIMGGLLAGLVAWIGALLNTWQLESKAWFIGLLLLGIFNLGFFAMVAYLIAGPDGRPDAAGKVEPIARPTPA